jgi:Arc/MetJ family transcription regulator
MRTTLDLDEDLLKKAMSATKSPTKTAVIEQGLRELIARAAREHLASLYGSDRSAKAPPRRRVARANRTR